MQGLRIESSPVGRVVVPAFVPRGFDLFWTTRDFDGRLTDEGRRGIRRTLRERGFQAEMTTCSQVHGVGVVRVGPGEAGCESGSCDALWSDMGPASIGIKVADCLPVTVIDEVDGVVGNAHAGWRGASCGVVDAMLDSIRGARGLTEDRLGVWLGPSIRVCCFEVGDEVVEQFSSRWSGAGRWVDRTRGDRSHIDLAAMTADILTARGVPPGAIFDSGLCTRCPDSMFHSRRRDGVSAGRNLAIVSRRR